MDRRDELAGDEAKEDPWREVVFSQTVGEVCVLGERVGEGEWDGLGLLGQCWGLQW